MRYHRWILSLVLPLVVGIGTSEGARTIRAIYFQRPADAPEKVHLYHEKGSIELELPGMNLSSRQEIPKGDLLMRCTLTPVVEGRSLPDNAPVVRVPEGWSDVIVLCARNPDKTGFPVLFFPLNASVSKFAPGELLCFNRTQSTLGGRVGIRKLRAAPGKSVLLGAPARGLGDYRVEIDYLPPGGKRALPLMRSTWRHEPAVRHILFVVDDPVRKVPRIWSIPDRIPPPPDPESSDGE